MKTFFVLSGRIVVILLAALAVVGVTMSVVDTSGNNRFPPDRREFAQQGAAIGSAAANTQGGFAQPRGEGREFRGERRGPRDQSLIARLTFGLLGMVKNFVIIGIVVVAAVWGERFWSRRTAKVAV